MSKRTVKTYEMAAYLEGMQTGMEAMLRPEVGMAFQQLCNLLKSVPDQTVNEFEKFVQTASKPKTSASSSEFIQQLRNVTGNCDEIDRILASLGKQTKPTIQDILREFGLAITGTKPVLLGILRDHLMSAETHNLEDELEMELVEHGTAIYKRLWEDPQVTVQEIRAEFEPISKYPKPVIYQIAKNVGFTDPYGSRDRMVEVLLTSLERYANTKLKGGWILNGV